ncbi:hypothetical protein [Curtobacterium sp. MCPF17_047]|uniref:hypothetical protein n=1 Tax=Curtobacterium sp. MCPF17_047 TaxID=2175654 RepID=UPI0011B487B5|nr:hypothetical protein [Curtobacterium sp. MCPF17_047]
MRFDEVLRRTDGPAVASEIDALRTPGRYVLEGVHQVSSGEHWQFRLDIDDAAQTWILERSRGPSSSYRDGIMQDEDGKSEGSFERSLAAGDVTKMALPTQLLWWGRASESLSPVLVQHVGTHSILVTFEHREDQAIRTTLVVDDNDGIARRRIGRGEEATIVTAVRSVSPEEVLPPAEFTPLTDWIRPSY